VLAWPLNHSPRGGSRGPYHRRRTITTPDLRGLALSLRVLSQRYVVPFTCVPRRGCLWCLQTYRPPTPPIPSVRRPMSFAVPSQLESQPSLTRPYRMVSFFPSAPAVFVLWPIMHLSSFRYIPTPRLLSCRIRIRRFVTARHHPSVCPKAPVYPRDCPT
jgi:hypothetical protein